MIAVLDTNILIRYVNPSDPHHFIVTSAVQVLRLKGFSLRMVPQNLYEFWVVATRPMTNNGLALTTVDCEQLLAKLETTFPVLSDSIHLCTEWRKLVLAHDCKGKVAHDARYVAAMNTHGIKHLLTFNVTDFTRYPGITVLDPNAIAAPPAPPGP